MDFITIASDALLVVACVHTGVRADCGMCRGAIGAWIRNFGEDSEEAAETREGVRAPIPIK